MIVAIAGATGLTGNLCLNELLQNEKIAMVYAMGRNQTGIIHPKLKEVILQNNKLSETIKADAFVCCLGTTIKKAGSKDAFKAIDLALPIYLAGELKNNACDVAAVISAMGANASSRIFYNQVKGKMEESMKQVNFNSLSILRPSIITGNRKEKRLGETIGKIVMTAVNPLFMGSLKNYKSISATAIAKALVSCIINQKNGTTIYPSDEVKKIGSKHP